jgi:hypothetical protein
MSNLRIFSYGGGVQSTAALVLAAQGEIDFPVFLFANTGDDSELPDTLRYVREVAMPYAAAHGIELQEVRRTRRDKTPAPTLYQAVVEHPTEIAIPIFYEDGSHGRRACTKHWKTVPIAKWTKAHGATPETPATLGLGISIDEWHRANMTSRFAWQTVSYPLLDLRMNRADCAALIERAGLPVPRKSSCWFCPFRRRGDWTKMKQENPSLYMNAVVLEQDIIAKRSRRGLSRAFLSYQGRELDTLIGDQTMLPLDDDDNDEACESGYCMV